MIHITVPGVPPTTNHAYYDLIVGKGKARRVQRVLTTEGKKYKRVTTAWIVEHYPTELQMFQPNVPYGYIIQVLFPNLINASWGGKAKTRYKRLDATNRVKLLEDSMAKAFGIDDCNFLSTRIDKAEGPEQTHVWVWNMEEECPYRGHV